MEYPTILKRIQSTLVDQVIAFMLLGVLVVLSNQINPDAIPLKALAFIIAFSYEPLMTYGSRTIGQRLTGIKVAWIDPDPSFRLLRMYCRFIWKILLGWVSFLTLFINKQKRTIHDLLFRTVVIYNKNEYSNTLTEN